MPGTSTPLATPASTWTSFVPSDGVYGSLLRPGRGDRRPAPERRHGCGSSTSCPTRAPSATSRAAPSRPATRRSSANGTITEDMLATLPSADLIAQIAFPTADQIDAANQALTDNWGPMVADA